MPVFCPEETPKKLTPHIVNFCKSLSHQEPLYVPVNPDPQAVEKDCFNAVAERCASQGGEIVFGWNIWTWPHLWLKAEHHAVWRAPNGDMEDITPKPNGASSILFLPDPNRPYDFENHKRLMNVLRALSTDPRVGALYNAEKAFFDYEEENTKPGTLEVSVNPKVYFDLEMEKNFALAELALQHIRSGQQCPCRSGNRFDECHRIQFLLLLGSRERL